MRAPVYAAARIVAPAVALHLQLHRAALPPYDPLLPPRELLPGAHTIESIVDAAFWASLRREEGYVPRISLAFLKPLEELRPLIFEKPLPLEPDALTRLAAAVERPGIHLGVWPAQAQHAQPDWLMVWGTTHIVPPFCFVVEVIAPGLLVLKHRPRHESRKFVNVAVLEGDRIKIVDERASLKADCPALLTSMLGFDVSALDDHALSVQVRLALSMRRHGRGGILLVVPAGNDAWRESIVHPITYAVDPAFGELAGLLGRRGAMLSHEWLEETSRAIDALAGLTAVDGAAVITAGYELLAFGAKITRRRGGAAVEQIIVTEPVEGSSAERMHPGQLGGTRHLSAAQFVHDQPGAVALVASQDWRFTIFAWSPGDNAVHAHRVEVLLL
ncbi:MAG: hypothetical protein EXQ53_13600 [Acidobacteria bacterium]|nr:hypothetical protein [Acidobacteriota bacterium]